jgi:hypothetical protein
VTAGVLPPERRPGAEFLAWSAVHGLAMLVIDGPLGPLIGPQMQQIGQHLLDMVEKGPERVKKVAPIPALLARGQAHALPVGKPSRSASTKRRSLAG